MKTILHKAAERGHAQFGWLDSHHSFSFGQYFDPDRIQFGKLRVLNDDIVQGGAGFPAHPHNNMEIISIPLQGALAHRDSTGTEKAIRTGEVQIMSAGSGITHSEYNDSKHKEVNFLQIWIQPKDLNIEPRYDQRVFEKSDRQNVFQNIVAPNNSEALWINQDAWMFLADIDSNTTLSYEIQKESNGAYVFVLEGDVTVGDQKLALRDALGIHETDRFDVSSQTGAKLLVIDVPMN